MGEEKNSVCSGTLTSSYWSTVVFFALTLRRHTASGVTCFAVALRRGKTPLLLHVNRSPGLAALSGFTGTVMCCVGVFRFTTGFMSDAASVWDMLTTPMLLTLYSGAYVFRGVRLLVMYNPNMRARWGRVCKQSFMIKTLLISYGAVLVIACSASVILGAERSGVRGRYPRGEPSLFLAKRRILCKHAL